MASPPRFQLPKATVCLTCGDKGDTSLLIYCRNCHDSAVHHYCLDNFSPDDDNIKWWCFDCKGKEIIKAEPLRKSERISFNKQKALNMRNHWKQKLMRRKRLVRISNGHLPMKGLETNLVNDKQRDLDFVYSSQPNASMENGPTCTAYGNLPDKQEHKTKSTDDIKEFPESGYNEKTLILRESDNAQNDGKDVALQVDNNHSLTSDTVCRHSLSADPIITPIWRGWFNIKEREICVNILAHLSSNACLKVSDAATALPPMLDVVLLDKQVTWPNSFRVAPPTATSIGLYFFPACERDERVYDSLLEEVMDRELALQVMIDNVQLLIFPSSELPLPLWRFNRKYFLWGVFKKMKSPSPKQRYNKASLSEPTATGNEEDLIRSHRADHPSTPNQAYQSPVSLGSSQASNVPPSMNNTPESKSLGLNKLQKTLGKR